jgi:hypothetical protein
MSCQKFTSVNQTGVNRGFQGTAPENGFLWVVVDHPEEFPGEKN